MLFSIFWPFGSCAADKQEWKEAESFLRSTLKIGNVPERWVTRVEEIPYGFAVYNESTGTQVRIVHQGALLPLGGDLPALDRFARESGLLKRKSLRVGTMDALITSFDAWPKPTPAQIFRQNNGRFAPTVVRTDEGFNTRFCWVIEHAPPPGIVETRPPPTGDVDLACWTLTLSSSHPAAWSVETMHARL